MTSQDLPVEVLYELRIAAHLRFDEPAARLNWDDDFYSEQMDQFIEGRAASYNQAIEDRAAEADAYELGVFEAPNYLLEELADISAKIRGLERFRDELIAFTRSFAVDPESMRAIASATGLSHTTIMRIADVGAIRAVASTVGPIVEDMLTKLSPRDNPDLYARLSKIAAEAKKASLR